MTNIKFLKRVGYHIQGLPDINKSGVRTFSRIMLYAVPFPIMQISELEMV